MMILMGAAVPTWRYVMQDDREQELFFRGDQIARAIERYQKKNGNTFPPSLEVLVKGKYLRRAYKDPMTKDGKWRFIRPGEAVPVSGDARPAAPAAPAHARVPSPPPVRLRAGGRTSVGAIAGVASRSQETSLRLFNGRTRYDQWIFLAGQPRLLGRRQGPERSRRRRHGAGPARRSRSGAGRGPPERSARGADDAPAADQPCGGARATRRRERAAAWAGRAGIAGPDGGAGTRERERRPPLLGGGAGCLGRRFLFRLRRLRLALDRPRSTPGARGGWRPPRRAAPDTSSRVSMRRPVGSMRSA